MPQTKSALNSSTRRDRTLAIVELTTMATISSVNKSKIKNEIFTIFFEIEIFLSRNVQCGSLQCKGGNKMPESEISDLLYSKTTISIKGIEYVCK